MKVTLHAFCSHCGKLVHATIDARDYLNFSSFLEKNPPSCLWCRLDPVLYPDPLFVRGLVWGDDIEVEFSGGSNGHA